MQKKRGISLIVLVITIIVMIILAATIIISLNNNGIINKAQDAVDKTNEKQVEELASLAWAEAYADNVGKPEDKLQPILKAAVEKALTDNGLKLEDYGMIVTTKGVSVARGWLQNDFIVTKGDTTIAIGDYINYTYDSAKGYVVSKTVSGCDSDQTVTQKSGLKWRVLGANENGQLELVSEMNYWIPVSLKNAAGYNNGVYLLNNICEKQYSNTALGAVARNLNIEDIEKQYSLAGIAARDGYIQANSGLKYGETKSYTAAKGANSYPVIYAQERLSGTSGVITQFGITLSDSYFKSNTELTDKFNTATGNLVATQTYYSWETTLSSYFKNETFYNMMFGDNVNYWLASREQVCGPNYIGFGLFRIFEARMGGIATFNSGKTVTDAASNIRPVITLPQDIVVTKNTTANSSTNMWQLSK